MKNAFFIATGTELLNFKANLYSPIISQKLKDIGYELTGEITTRDNLDSIKEALDFASKKANLIIICGGLGPTFDDLTRQAISVYLKTPLIFSKKIKKILTKKYGNVNKKPNLKNQCYVLKNAILIENINGTAFGEIISKDKKTYIILPGPKKEWEPMWDKITKYIPKGKKIYSLRFKLADIKEIELEHKLKKVIKDYNNKVSYTILAGPQICEFSLKSDNKKLFNKVRKTVENKISEYIYGYDEDTLPSTIGKILTQKNLTLSTAESCTGGLLSSTITDIPGSSRYFIGGINAYSNDVKIKFLGVREETLKKNGAVSEQTALEMVKGVNKIFNTSLSISITGIAGPSGGTNKKPVGTVFIAVIYNKKTKVIKKLFLNRDRKFIKEASVNTALWNLYKMIK